MTRKPTSTASSADLGHEKHLDEIPVGHEKLGDEVHVVVAGGVAQLRCRWLAWPELVVQVREVERCALSSVVVVAVNVQDLRKSRARCQTRGGGVRGGANGDGRVRLGFCEGKGSKRQTEMERGLGGGVCQCSNVSSNHQLLRESARQIQSSAAARLSGVAWHKSVLSESSEFKTVKENETCVVSLSLMASQVNTNIMEPSVHTRNPNHRLPTPKIQPGRSGSHEVIRNASVDVTGGKTELSIPKGKT